MNKGAAIMVQAVSIIRWLLIAFAIGVGALLAGWLFLELSCWAWDTLKSHGLIPLFLLRSGTTECMDNYRPGGLDLVAQIERLQRSGRCYSVYRIEVIQGALENLPDKDGGRVIETIAHSVIPGTIRSRDRSFRSGPAEFLVLYPDTTMEGALSAASRVEKRVIGYLERKGAGAPAERLVEDELDFTPGRAGTRSERRHLKGLLHQP